MLDESHSAFGSNRPNLPHHAFARHAVATLERLARKIIVDFRDAHSLLAAGGASEDLSLVPEVTAIIIGRAPC
jgi:hypothetical protein